MYPFAAETEERFMVPTCGNRGSWVWEVGSSHTCILKLKTSENLVVSVKVPIET